MEDVGTQEMEGTQENGAQGASLDARMGALRGEVEEATTEVFPLPGKFSGIIGVELRMLGWKTMRDIGKRHRRIRDESLVELYVCSDQIIAATVGFHETLGDDEAAPADAPFNGYKPLAGETYISLARRGVDNLPQDLTPRQALLALVKPDSLVPLWQQDYVQWMQENKPASDEAVKQGF